MKTKESPRRLNNRLVLLASILLIASSLFSLLVTAPSTHAETVTPGVSIGQWATYTISGSESGEAVSSRFTVDSVKGTNVTFLTVDTQFDGSNVTEYIWVDINIGPQLPSSGQYFVIAPGKNLQVSIYSGDYHYAQLPITDFQNRVYALANRPIAHVTAENGTTIKTTEDFYWDRTSGMFTEILKKTNGVETLHVTMDSTNIWNADNPFDALVIPSAIVTITTAAVIGILIFGFYRKKKGRITRSIGR